MQDQKLIFVTGKGGVGKSTLAASLALRHAVREEPTLLVELGDANYLSQLFDVEPRFEPQSVREHLDVAQFSGEACLRDFIRYYIKIERVVDLFFENRVMSALIKAAPGLSELSLLGKITSGIREVGPRLQYRNIVIDAFSTGHFLALMQVPYGFSQAVQFGPMGEQSRDMDKVLRDPLRTEVVTVTIPEEMAVVEAIELHGELKNQLQMTSRILLNKYINIPELKAPEDDFVSYLKKKKEAQEKAERHLKEKGVDFSIVPYCFAESAEVVNRLAEVVLE